MNSNVMQEIAGLRAEVLRFQGRLWFARTPASPSLKKGETDCLTLSHFEQMLSGQRVTNLSAVSGSRPVGNNPET